MALRCFLATESVSGTRPDLRCKRNNGSLDFADKVWTIVVRAFIGHNGEEPK